MRSRAVAARGAVLMLASACLFLASVPGGRAHGQVLPVVDLTDVLAGTTRKLDDYGKIGHCDETARLDNFAITLQNEPSTKGYLMVYVGMDDLPAWTDAILNRAAGYLSMRGINANRLKVVNAGYREKRSTELWIVADKDEPPKPTDTIEFKLDRTKAYKWNEKGFDFEFSADPDPEESEGENGAAPAGATDEAAAEGPAEKAGAARAVEKAAEKAPEAENAAEVEWQKKVEKYQIAVVERGSLEEESGADYSGADEDGGNRVAAAPPIVGEVKVSLWWDVEKLADELKAKPDSRLYLVYYWGLKSASREKVMELVERALVKTEEQLGLKRDRILTIDGGRSADPGYELWVVPRGAEPPQPRPEKSRNIGFYPAPGEE